MHREEKRRIEVKVEKTGTQAGFFSLLLPASRFAMRIHT
jgi:hypothetical protein